LWRFLRERLRLGALVSDRALDLEDAGARDKLAEINNVAGDRDAAGRR
jgi:hypothetical protein